MTYHTLQELQELAVQQKKEIWQVVQQEDMDASGRTQEQSYEKMHQMYKAMKNADDKLANIPHIPRTVLWQSSGILFIKQAINKAKNTITKAIVVANRKQFILSHIFTEYCFNTFLSIRFPQNILTWFNIL